MTEAVVWSLLLFRMNYSVVYETALYFTLVWVTAAWAGVSRCVRNGDWKSFTHCASVFCVSGFLGFAVVALVTDYRESDFSHIYGLGIAAVIGLAGREQTQLISIVWRSLIGKIDPRAISNSGVADNSMGDHHNNGNADSVTKDK